LKFPFAPTRPDGGDAGGAVFNFRMWPPFPAKTWPYQLATITSAPVNDRYARTKGICRHHLPLEPSTSPRWKTIEKEGIAKDRPWLVYCTVWLSLAYLARELKCQAAMDSSRIWTVPIIQWTTKGKSPGCVKENLGPIKVHPYAENLGAPC